MIPTRSFLLSITREWGRESALGDLATARMGPEDVEVRFWDGYGLTGTSGTVLRRVGGRWQAWRAEVQPCPVHLPIPVGDTIKPAALAVYREQARKNCGDHTGDTLAAETVFMADTVGLYSLPEIDYEAYWQELKRVGLLELPPNVPRTWIMADGFSYVVEVRRGGDYRASVIENATPETRADTVIQRLAGMIRDGAWQH
jgi:hypothetical protein